MNLLPHLRQLLFPKELRIGEPAWPAELWETLESAAQAAVTEAAAEGNGHGAATGEAPGNDRLLAEVGTGLWRMRQKMVDSVTGLPADELRRPYRHLESLWDLLTQAGVEIHDYTGAPYDAGLVLKVIAFEPAAGLHREKVLETIRPGVSRDGRLIQIGEVIVGRPPAATA